MIKPILKNTSSNLLIEILVIKLEFTRKGYKKIFIKVHIHRKAKIGSQISNAS